MTTRHKLGQWGEHTLMGLLSSEYRVKKAEYHYGDILLEDCIAIEVKTAQKTHESGEKYRFCLQTATSSTGHTKLWDARNRVDLVVLIIIDQENQVFYYLIPKSAIPLGKTHIVITSHPLRYRGRYTCYRVTKEELLTYTGLYLGEKRMSDSKNGVTDYPPSQEKKQ